MSILNKYFDKIYCINLDRRPDRWEDAKMEFKKHNIEVQRHSAVDGTTIDLEKCKSYDIHVPEHSIPGQVGCSMSHLSIVKDAKENNYSKILILEDDVVFDDNYANRFRDEISYLPEDWDLFYLSANNPRPEVNLKQVNSHFYKTSFSYTTHCYAINSKMYDIIIDSVDPYETPIDKFYVNYIQCNHNCYVIRPHLAWQRAGYSDIVLAERDYRFLRR